MLKLYKRGRAGFRYWEAWKATWLVVVHEGKLGDRGKTRHMIPEDGQTPELCIEEAAVGPRAKGYEEIPVEEQNQVVVQYRLKSWGSPADLEKGHKIAALFNECLGWTGNGRCDGHDIGGGTLNIFSVVVDAELGAATMVEELRKHRLLEGAVMAVREAEAYRVVYPARFTGAFSLL
jgi:hypothetical protein